MNCNLKQHVYRCRIDAIRESKKWQPNQVQNDWQKYLESSFPTLCLQYVIGLKDNGKTTKETRS